MQENYRYKSEFKGSSVLKLKNQSSSIKKKESLASIVDENPPHHQSRQNQQQQHNLNKPHSSLNISGNNLNTNFGAAAGNAKLIDTNEIYRMKNHMSSELNVYQSRNMNGSTEKRFKSVTGSSTENKGNLSKIATNGHSRQIEYNTMKSKRIERQEGCSQQQEFDSPPVIASVPYEEMHK